MTASASAIGAASNLDTAVTIKRPWFQRFGGTVVTYVILIAFFLLFLMPFVWIWFAAMKTSVRFPPILSARRRRSM